MINEATKHVVVSGCSFTISDGVKVGNNNKSWAWHLKDDLDKKISFHNVGSSGAGNYIISTTCIETVNSLLKNGFSPEEITVIVQWSGLFRPSIYTNENVKRKNTFFESNSKYLSKLKESNSEYQFYDTAGQLNSKDTFWNTYLLHYFSLPAAFTNTLEMILRLQWYLKSNKIKYLMFNAWDIFTAKKLKKTKFGNDIIVNENQFGDTIYNNVDNFNLFEFSPYSMSLWGMIDFNDFWLFKNENVKFGGMLQWIQNNINQTKWYVNHKNDFHIPSETSIYFYEQVISKLINKK